MDPELLPRTAYAQCLASLARTAKRFLEMTEAMKTEGTFKLVDANEFDRSPYEVCLSLYYRILHTLITNRGATIDNVRRLTSRITVADSRPC